MPCCNDDFATFEVIGHYNEPQSEQLSESSVNRLPDGTWMAIVRNDAGNYHFHHQQGRQNMERLPNRSPSFRTG